MPTRLLILDEDPAVQTALRRLTSHGYLVAVATTAREGWQQLTEHPPSLILMNTRLPDRDGLDFLKQLHDERPIHPPVILLTGNGDLQLKLAFMDAGAVDYVVRPCAWRELLARMRVQVRTAPGATPIYHGPLALLPAARACQVGAEEVPLSETEYRLLEHLTANSGQRLSRQDLLDACWPSGHAPQLTTLNSHLARLRSKLRQAAGGTDLIHAPYGSGVVLEVPTSLNIPEPILA